MRNVMFFMIAGAACCGRATSQVPRPEKLSPANGRALHEFVSLNSVRELADKRVLVTDAIERQVYLVDFASDKATDLGKPGLGPGEYRHATPLIALGGDSSIMDNTLEHEWMLFQGARGPVRQPSASPWPPVVPSGPLTSFIGRDLRGDYLVVQSPPVDKFGYPIRETDSTYIVLVSGSGGAVSVDTVGRLKIAMIDRKTDRAKITWEEAVLAPDGWLAVLRLGPYRVDWRSPDGIWTKGVPVSAVDPKISPYRPSPADRLPTLDGKLLVMRARNGSSAPQVYDVFNHMGIRERQLQMDAGQEIIGFGAGAVYVSLIDANGTVHLERHPWP